MLDARLQRYYSEQPCFCTKTNHPEEQTRYFKVENNNGLLKVFLSKSIKNCELPTDAIHFHIERVRSRTKNNGEKFDASGDSSPLRQTYLLLLLLLSLLLSLYLKLTEL